MGKETHNMNLDTHESIVIVILSYLTSNSYIYIIEGLVSNDIWQYTYLFQMLLSWHFFFAFLYA